MLPATAVCVPPPSTALSENLSYGKPLGVDILGSRVVLFRDDDGSVKCLDDTCPHRGAPLSEGWLATDDDAASGKKHTCVVSCCCWFCSSASGAQVVIESDLVSASCAGVRVPVP